MLDGHGWNVSAFEGHGLNEGHINEFYIDLAVPSDFSHWVQARLVHLKKGMQPIDVPTLEEVVATKMKVRYVPGHLHFTNASVAGNSESSFADAVRGADTQRQEAVEIGVVKNGHDGDCDDVTFPSIPTPSISTGERTTDGDPNAVFEALTDLFTSDGKDDAPPSTATVPRARVMPERAAFRDQSRRLDFGNICSMFEGQNHAESQGRIPVGAGEPDRRVLDSVGEGAKTDVVNGRDIVEDTNTPKTNPVTSTIRNSRPDRSGYPDVDGTVPSNDAPPPRDVLTTPFSFDPLNDALGSACDETRTLHRQYDELHVVRLGKGKELKGSKRKTTEKVVCGAHDSKTHRDATAPSGLRVPATTIQDGTEAGPQDGPKQVGDDGIAAEVARLSKDEARRALTAGVLSLYVIASMTNVRPSVLLSGDPSSARFKRSPSTRGNSGPEDIACPQLR
ncbi:hypothetical protein EDD15DRAFT_2375230 [Pisolithus albus]|nr:hypothetical protein EDD15DRAFT_2375230 [Pisolithus albus]